MRQPADIFEDYAKLAIESGLISESAEESKELKKYKEESYARVGSDDISTIEALYSIKPDSSIEYDYNIMEAAHPKPVVIGPAYDRLTALVENENENSAIMSYIALKPTDGLHTMHRYAKKELMMELIRIANDMDNRGNNEMRIAADKCIEQLTKPAEKSPEFGKIAFAPLVWAAVVGLSLAGTWLWSHADDPDRGIVANLVNAQKQLDDLKTNSWYRSSVDDTVVRDVNYVEGKLNEYRKYVAAFQKVMGEVYVPATLGDREELNKTVASTEGKEEQIKETIDAFIKATQDIAPMIESAIANFGSEAYQKEHTKETWVGEASGVVGDALHGSKGLFANDYTSVVNALDTLRDSIKGLLGKAEQFDSVKGQYAEKVNQAASWSDGKSEKSQKHQQVSELEDDVGEVGANEEFQGGGSVKVPEKASPSHPDDFYSKITNFLGHKPSDKELKFLEGLGK